MTIIKNLTDEIKDELCSAKEYAEEYLTFKMQNDSEWARKYEEMAHDELKHAGYLHDRVVEEIEEIRKTYTPPESMMEKWESEHKKYIEKAAWVKQMLSM